MTSSLKDIANNLTPERVIELVTELGSDTYIERNDYIQFKTICHNINPADASMKLYYYKKNKKFHCYTDCSDNFNIYELFKRRYELLGREYDFYKDIVLKIAPDHQITENNSYAGEGVDFDKYRVQEIKVDIPALNPSILNVFTFYPTQEWLNDGISIEAMEHYNILYSIGQNKIIIPHYDAAGSLIGIRGRSLNPEELAIGKYMPVQIEGKTYAHPLGYNLYGLNLVKDNIAKFKMAIVAEGEKSALQYETMFGKDNNICVATCGSSFHAYQLDLLLTAGAEKILIAFDKEGETWSKKDKYYYKLREMCERYSHKCNIGFVWDSTNLLNLKDSPFDKGKETFLKLWSNVEWV